mmetsp:Transcript_1987/g.3644  ORF Transcript_1987/g.3644 Transcript_1987/m.3644 type:complete len:318 (-) Transcript_1987:599-1552(-)
MIDLFLFMSILCCSSSPIFPRFLCSSSVSHLCNIVSSCLTPVSHLRLLLETSSVTSLRCSFFAIAMSMPPGPVSAEHRSFNVAQVRSEIPLPESSLLYSSPSRFSTSISRLLSRLDSIPDALRFCILAPRACDTAAEVAFSSCAEAGLPPEADAALGRLGISEYLGPVFLDAGVFAPKLLLLPPPPPAATPAIGGIGAALGIAGCIGWARGWKPGCGCGTCGCLGGTAAGCRGAGVRFTLGGKPGRPGAAAPFIGIIGGCCWLNCCTWGGAGCWGLAMGIDDACTGPLPCPGGIPGRGWCWCCICGGGWRGCTGGCG